MGVGAANGPFSLGSLSMSPIFFRFGPGLPRAFGVVGVPSMVVALRFVPGFGPLRFADGGAKEDGVLVPFMAAVESTGVSAAVGSMVIWGASEGGEVDFDSGAGAAMGSCGNAVSAVCESLSVTTSDFGFAVIFALRVPATG